jgi:hypothetical protein
MMLPSCVALQQMVIHCSCYTVNLYLQNNLPIAPEGNLGLTSTASQLDEGTRGFVQVSSAQADQQS